MCVFSEGRFSILLLKSKIIGPLINWFPELIGVKKWNSEFNFAIFLSKIVELKILQISVPDVCVFFSLKILFAKTFNMILNSENPWGVMEIFTVGIRKPINMKGLIMIYNIMHILI